MEEKEQIRIAHIVGKWIGGGVESIIMNYYRNINHKKIQFDFFCDSDSTDIPYEEIEKLGGKVILIPPYQKIFKYHKELKKRLKEGEYKIVHSHINTLSVFSLYAAKKANTPIRIAHSHSTTNKKEYKKNIMKLMLRPFSKKFATHYFCCSELAGKFQFGTKTYNEGNVYLLNNAIDIEKFKYNQKVREKKRKELQIKENTLVIGHIGRFVTTKNHTFLIDIIEEIKKQKKEVLLILVGKGPLEEEIKKKVKEKKLEENVLFLGQRKDANELYQAFDIFVMPSLYEGLPVVAVEAQSAGLPCILSKEIIKEAKALSSTKFIGLEEDKRVWAKEMIKTMMKIERINTEKNIEEKGFNIKRESQKLEKKYRELIGE